MVVISEFDARLNMKAFIDRARRPYSEWYTATSTAPRERLFRDHGVDEASGWWFAEELESAEAARRVQGFLVKLGCESATDEPEPGVDAQPTSVYAYLKVEGRTTP